MTEWDRVFWFSFFFFFFPLCLVRKAVGCGLHVLYITDICHAGISNSNPCETFHSFRFGLTKAGGTKEGPGIVLKLVCRRSQFSKGQRRGGNAACRDFFSYLIKTQM